jgi:hypothetical protein
MRRWVVACAVAGCSQHYGAYIDVTAPNDPMGFDQLELFFTKPDGQLDPLLAPRNTQAAGPFVSPTPATAVWYRQYVATIDTWTAPDNVPVALRSIEVPTGQLLGAELIVVGYRAGNVVGFYHTSQFAVPGTDYYKYDAKLDTVPPMIASSGWPVGAEVWAPTMGGQSCARFTDQDASGTTTFVVTEGDTDCDGFDDATVDCSIGYYCDPNAATPPNGTVDPCETACVAPAPVAMSTDCVIGACSNRAGGLGATTCNASAIGGHRTCVQCTQSCDDIQKFDFFPCLAQAESIDATCNFFVDTAGVLCNANPATLKITLPPLQPSTCANPILRAPLSDSELAFVVTQGASTSECELDITVTYKVSPPPPFKKRRLLIELPNTPLFVGTILVDALPAPIGVTGCAGAGNSCTDGAAAQVCN